MLNEEYYFPLTSPCDVINAEDRINTYILFIYIYHIRWEQSFLLSCSPPSDPTGILNTHFFLLWLFHIRTESLRGKVKIVAITTKSRVHDFFFLNVFFFIPILFDWPFWHVIVKLHTDSARNNNNRNDGMFSRVYVIILYYRYVYLVFTRWRAAL